MNDQFIQGVIFDWDKIDKDSYLKRIRAFKGVEKLDFNKPITFFVGENGSGKSTLLEALAVAQRFHGVRAAAHPGKEHPVSVRVEQRIDQ